jgi:hypothetical protein
MRGVVDVTSVVGIPISRKSTLLLATDAGIDLPIIIESFSKRSALAFLLSLFNIFAEDSPEFKKEHEQQQFPNRTENEKLWHIHNMDIVFSSFCSQPSKTSINTSQIQLQCKLRILDPV